MRLKIAVRLPFVDPLALAAPEGRLQPVPDEAFLDPVDFAQTDSQDVRHILSARPTLVELPLVAVEQDQGVDHSLRLVRTLAREDFQILPLLLRQRHLVLFHLGILLAVDPEPRGL